MNKRMLRSVLATAFVVALASGAAGPLDVGWSSPAGAKTAALDVGWDISAAGPGDVGWVVTGGDGAQDVGWSTPAGADA